MSSFKKWAFVAVTPFLSCFIATKGLAQAFIYPGIQTSIEAGLSQTNTRGASAVITNPANISVMTELRVKKKGKKRFSLGLETYADISLMTVEYTYTRPGYDPVRVATTVPPITLGLAWKPSNRFALGMLFIPRPSSKGSQLQNVPQDQGKDVLIVNVESVSGSAIFGLGASFRPNPNLSLGFSVQETAEDNKISATPVDNGGSDTPLLQASNRGSFLQYLLGVRGKIGQDFIIGASYKTAVVKKYQGDVSISGGTPEPTKQKDYMPAVIAVGGEKLIDSTVVFGEYRREMWAAGGSQFASAQPGGPVSKDYRDANIFIGGARYQWGKGHAVGAAVGRYGNNAGFGSALDSNGKPLEGDLKAGVGLGEFGAIDRTVFAAGYRSNFAKGYFSGGVNIQNGTRTVPVGYGSPGTYALNVYTIALGGSRNF